MKRNIDILLFKATYLLNIDGKWSFGLTFRARSNPHFSVRVLEERTQDSSTFAAIILDLLQLREHT